MIPLPKGPWETVRSDICLLNGIKYIQVVDYYSKYIEIAILDKGENARRIIEKLKSIFSRHGIPNTLISDNGPQYACEKFRKFAESYTFIHTTSSPRYPKGNGMARKRYKQ